MISMKNTCLNCGKPGHIANSCHEKITSYGIICFNINSILNITNKKIEEYFFNKYLDLDEYNYSNLHNINLIPKFYNNIKVILVRRKHSLNYIEFMRGRYSIDSVDSIYNIQRIIQLMSIEENIRIKNNDFDTLWNELWKKTANSKKFQKEYKISKNKFNRLKENNFYNLLDSVNLSKYTEPEWEFPKGRKNVNENNLECAVREFKEETNIPMNKIHVLERLKYVEEEYKGTNDLNYRNIFYLASCNNMITLSNKIDNYEISDIRWVTIPEAINMIRPYYYPKIKLIHQLYFFIINLVDNINKMDTNDNNIITKTLYR